MYYEKLWAEISARMGWQEPPEKPPVVIDIHQQQEKKLSKVVSFRPVRRFM